MRGLWPTIILSLASTFSAATAVEPVEKVTVHSTHPVPSKRSRITSDVELWQPFGNARLIADLNPANGDLVRLSLEYGGRVHSIDHPLLHATKLIYPQGIVITNIEDEVDGRTIKSVLLFIPYVGDKAKGDCCCYNYISLFIHPDDTVKAHL